MTDLREDSTVVVCGDLRPGGRVVLVDGDRAVWPVRRVRRGLHPWRVQPYED